MDGTEGCFLSEINLTEKDNSSMISLICEIQKKKPFKSQEERTDCWIPEEGFSRWGMGQSGQKAKTCSYKMIKARVCNVQCGDYNKNIIWYTFKLLRE